MEILIKLDLKDYYSFQKYLEKEIPKTMWPNGIIINLVVWIILGFTFATLIHGVIFHWPTAFVVALIFVVLIIYYFIFINKFKTACAPSEGGISLRERRYVFDDEGISSFGDGYEVRHSWALLKRVVRANGSIFLLIDNASAYVFPEYKLEKPDEFYSYVNSRVE